ncbi:phosphotransferase enzyme family protein [Fictibacillus phosphorivorans]|uniref:phosphotransferase enzyme family protein n=1 Tax=Fictibacillus phosphorivorans TaxID=1221500 RepID=UPI00203EE0DC|nr:phosphotransferase [Fictibacillus phosphorivorans]MCM3777759.1 phosphotransferase [Fictibacillus phosphorivorans]
MFGFGDISFFNKCFNKLIEGLNELPKTHQGYGIIHGDPNPSNFFYSEEDGFSLFDFDHCAYGYRIHDLAVIKRSFPENVFGAVLDGYKKLRPLQAFEKNYIETYSNILLVTKFRDIFNMLEIKRASLDNMKIVALHAYNTIKEINGTPEN